MAKRFIDTGLFDDSWFMELSKDAKLLWIYVITKCNHAGIIEYNEKLWKFQTGLNNIQTVIEQLGNRLSRVDEQYIFIPKFLTFQYPNFPNSKVNAQKSAIELLTKLKLFDNSSQRVVEPLLKGYEYEYGYDNGNGYENEYRKFKHLSITIEENKKLLDYGFSQSQIESIYYSIENYKKNTSYTSLYLTALKWLKKEHPEIKPIESGRKIKYSRFGMPDKMCSIDEWPQIQKTYGPQITKFEEVQA